MAFLFGVYMGHVEKFRLPYPIGGQDITISMPYIAQILRVGQWGSDFVLWGLINTEEPKRSPITLWIVPDNESFCGGLKVGKQLVYLATVQMKFQNIMKSERQLEEKQTAYHFFIEAHNAFLIERTVIKV